MGCGVAACPTGNVRRVFYYGYTTTILNRFQSSLPIGGPGDPPGGTRDPRPKLNDQWLTAKRGGPVRMLVPGSYANASVNGSNGSS
jgi:hypothetical protein